MRGNRPAASAGAPLQVLSVCMTLPTQRRPQQGLFVYRRLQAMAQHLPVRALRPQPWFPGLRGHVLESSPPETAFPIDCRRMFYLPAVAKAWDGRWMERCVDRWLEQLQPDPQHTVLDAHFAYPEGVACHRAAARKGLPFFITLRGVEEVWFRYPAVRRQMVAALNDAAGVMAVSESLRAAAIAAGVRSNSIHVIPNGCDTATFHPGDQASARAALGLDPQRHLLVCVADLRRVKGHDLLVRALGRLQAHRDFQLLCIGAMAQSRFVAQLRRDLQRRGLEGRVDLLGSRPPHQVAQYLRAADLFVLASRREGCCNAILEALACGTPVVATAVGGNPELAHRYAGIQLVDAENSETLAVAIEAMLQGTAPLTSAGRERFAARPWQDVAAECVRFMRHACGREADQRAALTAASASPPG